MLKEVKNQFVNLANASDVKVLLEEEYKDDKDGLISLVFNEFKVLMNLDDLMDYDKERSRLREEIKRLESEIKRASGKLNNQNFVNKAPEYVVLEERKKLSNYEDLLKKTMASLEEIRDK